MKTLKITPDYSPESPRTWDNLGIIFGSHKRYNLSDDNAPDYDTSYYGGWDDIKKQIIEDYGDCIVLPVYMYEHSGIALSTTPFSCGWDSGQVGYIFVEKSKVRKEYGVKRITKSIREKVEDVLRGEIETYSQYVNGDVYCFEILDEEGECTDSCCGFYGNDPKTNGMMDNINGNIEEYEVIYKW